MNSSNSANTPKARITFPYSRKKGNVTATIYKNKNSLREGGKDFKLAYYDLDGKRRFRSFPDFESAKAEMDKILKKAEKGELETLEMSKVDLVAFTRAARSLKPWGVPLDIAAGNYAEACKILNGDRVLEAARYFVKFNPIEMPQKTVKEVFNELVIAKTDAKRSPLYVADLRYRIGLFVDSFSCQIASITPELVRRFLAGLDLSPRSHNNFIGAIRTLSEFAKSRGYLTPMHDMLQGVEKMADTGEEIEVFTSEEMARLLAKASSELRPVLAIGSFAGLRSAEILRLHWEDINLPERLITVTKGKAKTRSRRTVPILDNLAAWLAPYGSMTGKVWPHSVPYFYESAANIAESTAVKDESDKQLVPAVKWKANGMRHSFISYRLAIVKNESQVALDCGNSPKMIHGNYKGLVTEKQAKAWFAISPEAASNIIPMVASV